MIEAALSTLEDADPGGRRDNGWGWFFVCVDHFTAEAWVHVSAVGDCHAALQPVYDAVVDRGGEVRADTGRRLALRHDWGPQCRLGHCLGSLHWLGISDDGAYVGEPKWSVTRSRTSSSRSSSSRRPEPGEVR